MADNKNTNNLKNFRINRIKDIKEMYASEESSRRRYDRTYSYSAGDYTTAKAVRQALIDSVTNKDAVVDASRKMFQTSPIYAYLVNYLSNLFMWRYKVLPHRVYSKSKAKARKVINTEDYGIIPVYQKGGALVINPEFSGIAFHNGGVDDYRHIHAV